MDETSVCMFQGGAKGTVLRSKRHRGADEPVERASLAKKRTCLTHCGMICDRSDLQPLLPQVIIGNCATFLLRDWESLRAGLPPNVHLIRQKSAWNNVKVCVWIIGLLHSALRGHLEHLQPILFLDACRLHLHRGVIAACARHGIWVVIIPAKLTWLLQPCDTHAFQRYKAYLKSACQRRRAQADDGALSVRCLVESICETILHVLQGQKWTLAFDLDGFGRQQEEISMYLQRQLGLNGAPMVASSRPSEEQVGICFPRRSKVPYASLLRPFLVEAPVSVVPRGYRLLAGVGAALGPGPVALGLGADEAAASSGWRPRTRAEHRLVAALTGGLGPARR